MKAFIQRVLQKILGYESYLWYFTLYKLRTLKYDKHENDFFYFLSLIPNGSVTLDIGANLGLMSYHLAKQSKETYAFEPMPNNIKVLKRVKSKYNLSNLTLLTNALGNENKKIQLVLPEVDGVKKQGLSHVIDDKMEDFNDGTIIETDCYRLDDVETLKDINIAAIKIDVENFEYEVFLGGLELIRTSKPTIYCELWDNRNRLDCFHLMRENDYDVFVFENNKLKQVIDNPSHIQNFFFLPKAS